jgi:hypothetical protein
VGEEERGEERRGKGEGRRGKGEERRGKGVGRKGGERKGGGRKGGQAPSSFVGCGAGPSGCTPVAVSGVCARSSP